jgi:predicted transcriptional regulator
MDFGSFEQLVLRVLFETPDPLGATHLAYLARIPVQRAERYLARMVEQGSIAPRVNAQGNVEYGFAGRRDLRESRRIADEMVEARPGDPETAPGEEVSDELQPAVSSATAVLLSVLVPGAGHIYAGRSGAGVAWMATTLAGYACCLLPGLFLHGLCLVSAAHTREIQ